MDDNPGDAELLRQLLRTLNGPHEAYFAVDGVDALDFLYRRGPYVDAPAPNLILLDINMPQHERSRSLGPPQERTGR